MSPVCFIAYSLTNVDASRQCQPIKMGYRCLGARGFFHQQAYIKLVQLKVGEKPATAILPFKNFTYPPKPSGC